MSLHLNLEDYTCEKCSFKYFPYKNGYPCPQCNFVPNPQPSGYSELVENCVRSLKINKSRGDMFVPMGWSITSYSDQVLLLIAQIFEILETPSLESEAERIDSIFAQIGNDEPTEKHLRDIFVDVRAQYKIDPYIPEKHLTWFERLTAFFKK